MEDLKLIFLKLKSDNNEEFCQAVETFLNDYATSKKFEFLDNDNLRGEIWEALFNHLNDKDQQAIHKKCLAVLRILSRDNTDLNNIITKEKLDVILEHSGLNEKQEKYFISEVAYEAQKLIYNIIFNSPKVQNIITETNCLQCLVDRISKFDQNTEYEYKLFDVRILVLITITNKAARKIVNNQLNGIITLIRVLRNFSDNCSDQEIQIKDNDAKIAVEILKALFNLFYEFDECFENLEEYQKMTLALRNLLLSENEKNKDDLTCQIINLLVVIPVVCYCELIRPLSSNRKDIIEFQGYDVTALKVILTFLNNKLDCKTDLIENLTPILTSLIKMCKIERVIRKYVRMEILPPLKDATNRPEEGTTLRNKLCKLLTNPLTNVKILTADFLFVLCKEKVGRMIKYTGYGNSAGMFAAKGYMGSDHAKVDYSSDSEDSETEEYEKIKDRVNPVTGCYESLKSDPLEGMSEEQKEYEAMKLVNLVDKLQRGGVIQPCRVGEDGKPQPIEHVLELEECLPNQQIRRQNSDSD